MKQCILREAAKAVALPPFQPKVAALAIALAMGLPAPLHAASDPALAQIREQIKDLKKTYQAQMQALEKRLEEAEARARKAEAAATQAQSSAVQAQSSAAQASVKQATPNAFNPAISLILNGTYANLQRNPDEYKVDGFLSNADAVDQDKVPGKRGFSLGESELFISANVDPWFSGALNLALEPDNTISVEEAYFQTLGLGHGFSIKGGRFFSAIGYQNSIHAHAWDFEDPALMQRVFLGDNYGDDGLQLSWVAPTRLFIELGGEIGRGKDAPGTDRNKNGIGAATLFAHVGGDIGTGGSYRVGFSTLRTSTGGDGIAVADLDERTGVPNLFTGDTRLYGVDFVYKWAPNGDYYYRNLKLVAEWFQLRHDGQLAFDTTGVNSSDSFDSRQSGWYVQGVYQFHPYWRVGLRYDQLDPGSIDAGLNEANGITATDYTPRRYSAMIDWSPSEFSRIRLQYNLDQSREAFNDNQVFLQYIFSLGTHGAHKF
jgi:hypothetical protein